MKKQDLYLSLMQAILEAFNEAGIEVESGSIRLGYSGRGMYGTECLGLVMSANDFPSFNQDLVEILINRIATTEDLELLDLFKSVKTAMRSYSSDSMGLDQIQYYPDIKIPDGVRSELVELISDYQ